MSAGTVYVIQAGAYFKIGRTKNITQRLEMLRTGSPVPLTVHYQLETPTSHTLERYLHQRFHAGRVSGEWFTLEAADVEWMRSIQQWTQDDADRLGVTVHTVQRSQPRVNLPPVPGTLAYVLQRHGITTIKALAHQAGLTRQHAWNLWHGQAGVGKAMMKRLHERLHIPLEDLILVDQPTPPRPMGRPRKARRTGEPTA